MTNLMLAFLIVHKNKKHRSDTEKR